MPGHGPRRPDWLPVPQLLPEIGAVGLGVAISVGVLVGTGVAVKVGVGTGMSEGTHTAHQRRA